MRVLIRLVSVAAAVWVAERVVPGITVADDLPALLGIAVVFAVVNAVVKPIVTVLSLPFVFLTLGLLLFVINAALFLLTAALSTRLGFTFTVDGFWPALLGSLVVSVVSAVLAFVLTDDRPKD